MPNDFNLQEHSHRRFNILTNEWILVSPERMKRGWKGSEEKPQKKTLKYDSKCYLCPGNKRERSGKINPDYKETFVFENDTPAFKLVCPEGHVELHDILKAKPEKGICRVIAYSPRHDLTLSQMNSEYIQNVIKVWIKEYTDLGNIREINYVQIIENKGELVGSGNPHPHGQIWAQNSIPKVPFLEGEIMKEFYSKNNISLLSKYLAIELELKERIILANEDFIALVPFWATWPFETMIISRRHFQNLTQMRESEIRHFATILQRLTIKYDKLFGFSFPYSSGIHQSPTDGRNHSHWHFHMHFYPPLLTSKRKKFMAGYEMFAELQRDMTPEKSAEALRSTT